MPEDIGRPMVQHLQILLASKDYVIDWWEGDPRPGVKWDAPEHLSEVYFPRPAHIKGRWPTDASYGGRCVFLGERGCRLPPKQRPAVCRALEPKTKPEDHCVGHIDKHDLAMAWLPYQEEITEALALVRRSLDK
jgi:Fe-S-cluster containining protein